MQIIFFKAGIICMGFLFFLGIPACSVTKDADLKDSDIATPLAQAPVRNNKKVHAKYPGDIYMNGVGILGKDGSEADIAAEENVLKPADWDDGVRDLVNQMLRRLPMEGILTVRVGEFSDGWSGDKVSLSELIESDISITLASVEDIIVLDKNQSDSDLLLTGIFRRDGEVLRINATMKDMKTGAIISAGRVLISDDEIQDNDSLPTHSSLNPLSPPFLMKDGDGKEVVHFDTVIEQILTLENSTAPFNLEIWSEKDQFRIGEPVTFYLKVDRDCYITLLDHGTSGTLRVLFPNPFQRDNFIVSGKTYIIPDPAAGYEIRVDGPPGIERLKAIATLRKSDQPLLGVSDEFYAFSLQEVGRLRDMNSAVTKLQGSQWEEGGMKIDILGPDSPEGVYYRRIKPKRPDKPVDIIGTPGAIDRDDPGVIEPKQPEKPVDILGVPGVKMEE